MRSAVIAEVADAVYFNPVHGTVSNPYFPMSPNFSPPQAVYIHVPFCAHRCGYCDFTLVAGKDHLIDGYLRALEIELSRVEGTPEISTLFFGGGTPTHLPPDALRRLFESVLPRYRLAAGYEFSVEANPAGLDKDKIAILADAGVNRVSLGIQSFDADVLTVLERDHRQAEIDAALNGLRRRIDNIALDLIFAVPGQSLALWNATLETAIAYAPQHLSTYGLTFEKGTAFWTRREKSQLIPATSELEREMYALAIEKLPAAGFEHYEISNFARLGYRCRHNEVYWTGQPYDAFGPGAARYLGGRRTTNHRSVTTWLKRTLAGESPVGDTEMLSPEESAREAIALGLRRRAGIDLAEFRQRTGYDLIELAGETVAALTSRGRMGRDNHGIRLSPEGLFFADFVAGEFL